MVVVVPVAAVRGAGHVLEFDRGGAHPERLVRGRVDAGHPQTHRIVQRLPGVLHGDGADNRAFDGILNRTGFHEGATVGVGRQ